jgi:hypothetical protein
MAYFNTNLIARRGYAGRPMSGLAGILDDAWSAIKGGASSAVSFYGDSQKQAGAAAALATENEKLTAALAAKQAAAGPFGGIDTTTLLVGVAAMIGAVMLLRRK